MACQGCGRNSQSRLCCPTCIEFGRTSFFCGQECFTANWKAHDNLHALLRQTRDAGGGSAASDAATNGGTSNNTPLPRVQAEDRRGGPPLAGGSSGLSSLGSKKGAAASARGAAGAAATNGPAGGVLGSIVGQAWSMLGSSARSAGSSAGPDPGKMSRSRAKDPSGSVRIRSRSPAPKAAGAKGGQTPAAAKTPRLAMHKNIVFLAAVTVLGFYYFYHQHKRLADEQIPTEEALAMGPSGGLASSIANAGASPVAAAAGSDADLVALRSQVAAVRAMAEKHEQMLRYVMDRFVEKKGGTATGGGSGGGGSAAAAGSVAGAGSGFLGRFIPAADTGEGAASGAASVKLATPEDVGKSVLPQDGEPGEHLPRAGDGPRKRKGAEQEQVSGFGGAFQMYDGVVEVGTAQQRDTSEKPSAEVGQVPQLEPLPNLSQ
eukprot:TRINITY_DN25852_c0_g1_i1.p1 TRINITY_DN25852_c0_g1~~TRINITY_DN25852_c0_g1_i1.p1  ORF type:complete len:432 (-),score=85.12 TRINITY_DN25852_c0_g1_i1:382-1677(-)